jgi:uncharacterized protein (DUF2141 family)
MKAWVIVLPLWLAALNLRAENTYEISGRVLINEGGVLHIYLVDEDQFSVPFTGIKEVVISITSAHLESGFAQFSFPKISSGHYGIRVFIDTNGNDRLDRGLLGPHEPWGMSWQGKRISGIPHFKDIAFFLEEDIQDLVIDSHRD